MIRALALWLLPCLALAGEANLSWSHPTLRTDGSAYTNPAGYRIWERCGTDPLVLLATAQATENTYQRLDIPDDGRTCFWSLTAFDLAGLESIRSNEASKTFAIGLPSPPSNLVITWAGVSSMAAVRTGTASQVDASAAESGSASVTVPADATAVVATYHYWDSNANQGAPSFTLNGVSMTSQLHVGDTGNIPARGVQTLVSPATGTQTFAWDWGGATGARAEGGLVVLTYVKGVNTADLVRDVKSAGGTTSTEVSITVTTISTDLVIAHSQKFHSTTDSVLDGTNYLDNVIVNLEKYDVSEVTPGASSVTINMTNEDYSTMVGISLKEEAAGGAAAPAFRLSLLGAGR